MYVEDMHSSPSSRILINSLYFGFFLLALFLMSACSLFTQANLDLSSGFFLLYAFGQSLLEITLFVFLSWILERYFPKGFFIFFIGFTFIVFLLHILDFFMNRILDLSLFQALVTFVFYEDLNNFIYLLDASGISLWIWGIFFLSLLFVPWMGWLLYQLTSRLTANTPRLIKKQTLFLLFSVTPIALLFWDLSTSHTIHPDAYTEFAKALPWKHTLLHPKNILISLPGPIKLPPQTEEIATLIEQFPSRATKKPNIYLFVIESLREDFLSLQTAPHLSRFREENLHFPFAVSNGNGSHLSWFSIFHSQFSYHWSHFRDHPRPLGSPPLQLLKKLGYQIHIYSSAQLGYYGMEKVLFDQIPDSYTAFPHKPPIQTWQADQATLESFAADLQTHPEWNEGQLFIFFWDATHFDYSWPKDKPLQFSPISQEFAYFQAYQSKENIELIKNRYRNAIHYVDSLFGQFLEKTPDLNQSILVVMGDHGEEFFEQGHLFHNSHLVKEQFHIPLYFHFPSPHPEVPPLKVVSQIDIFPSILDFLTGQIPPFCEGASIFRPNQRPYALIARFNGGRTPYEFCLHNGTNQLTLRFNDSSNPLDTKTLQILSLKNCQGRPLQECQKLTMEWIQTEFGASLERLVENSK